MMVPSWSYRNQMQSDVHRINFRSSQTFWIIHNKLLLYHNAIIQITLQILLRPTRQEAYSVGEVIFLFVFLGCTFIQFDLIVLISICSLIHTL